jgi:NIPSNAP
MKPMLKNYRTALFVAAALVVGYGVGRVAEAQSQPRVFELRTYHVNPGKMDDIIARFRDETFRVFAKHKMTPIIFGRPQDNPEHDNEIVYILAHPSREAATKAWDDFRKDPEWIEIARKTQLNGQLVNKVDSVFFDPVDFSPIK